MAMRSLAEMAVAGKKVLVRVDFNVELDDRAHIQEGYRLEVVKNTLKYLLDSGAGSIALLSHYGRPEGTPNAKYSLSRLRDEVERVLGQPVVFVDVCFGEKVSTALQSLPQRSLLLLENVRFHAEEEANDAQFSRNVAAPFDLFVNEAFSASHRAHASIVGIPQYLESCAGFRFIEEVTQLSELRESPARPAVAIIGGAKIETKLPLIRAMEETYDCVLVGGKIANEAIDQKIEFGEKVLLPKDFDSDQRLDIGPHTAAFYAEIIKKAKTIVWNGPMGKFEEKPYDFGTQMILAAILESDAFVVIGGGESLAVLEKAGVFSKIGFVSSGGGAMLEFLSGKALPGMTALEAV